MFFNYQDLLHLFNQEVLEWGQKTLPTLKHIHLNIQHNGELITADINHEQVYIYSERDANKRLKIQPSCSCRQHHCRHIVLALLATLAQTHDSHTPHHNKTTCYWVKFDIQKQQVIITTEIGIKDTFSSYQKTEPLYLNTTTLTLENNILDESDLPILDYLRKYPESHLGNSYRLTSADGAHKLQQIIKTGRAFLAKTAFLPLSLGELQPASFSWHINQLGQQTAQWKMEEPTAKLIELGGIWSLNTKTGTVAPVDSRLPSDFIEYITHLTPIEPDKVNTVQQHINQHFPSKEIPPLRPIHFQKVTCDKPTPHLTLQTQRHNNDNIDIARLTFDYQGYDLSHHQETCIQESTLLSFDRNRVFEQACEKQLKALDFTTISNKEDASGDPLFSLLSDPEAWFKFQLYDQPLLEKQQWNIHLEADFRHTLSHVKRWFGSLTKSQDSDWFSMKLGVEINKETINLLPVLVALVKNYPKAFDPKKLDQFGDHEPMIIPISDTKKVAFPAIRIRNILETLFELYQKNCLTEDGSFELSRVQLLRLSELNQKNIPGKIQWSGEKQEFNFVQALRDQTGIDTCEVPNGLSVNLRDYQHTGLEWLQFLRKTQMAGILADDMGLGKTIQTLSHILLEKEQGRLDKPCLIIAPTSLMGNWRRETATFTPNLSVLTLQGSKRKTLFSQIPDHDIVLSTYPLLGRDTNALMAYQYHMLILDEAQIIKNPRTKASQTVRLITARHRLCLTGTPMENHLGELWSLFHFLLPGLLGNEKEFKKQYRNPIEKQRDTRRSKVLSERIRPFLLRRTKENVASELPAKTEIIRTVELTGDQRELYEVIRIAGNQRIQQEVSHKGMAKSKIIVLDALLKLRQVCCDPKLVKIDKARQVKRSAKLDLLMEMLPEMIEEGRHILLFSQFTEMLAIIEQHLIKAHITYAKLTGKTKNRDQQIYLFQSNQVPVFLVSLKAGGVGLNLTAADVVIHYDPWWNPAVERQATDRAYRLGQDKPVFVYKLITEGTVEEKIQLMQEQKQQLADSLFDDKGEAKPQWTEDDIARLLSPID